MAAPLTGTEQEVCFVAASPAGAVPVDVPGAAVLGLRLAWLALHLAELAQLRGYYAIFQEFDQ